tara:strand:+ start:592 stop:960 length:369 start_codon:yes stop_codon:yes gene_type:complete
MAANEVTLTKNVSNISVSQTETKVTVTPGASAVVVAQVQSKPSVSVAATTPSLNIQQGQAQVVQVVDTGPQGPPFTGATFFNVDAISQLDATDIGKVVAWDGTEFQPTNILENDLTISGGAF